MPPATLGEATQYLCRVLKRKGWPTSTRAAAAIRLAAWAQHSDNAYTQSVIFTWDPEKAEANLKKHGVNFREAATVFDDTSSTAFPDRDHSVGQRRFLIIGMSVLGRVLVVSYIEVNDQTIRIISARPATRYERTFYEEDETRSR